MTNPASEEKVLDIVKSNFEKEVEVSIDDEIESKLECENQLSYKKGEEVIKYEASGFIDEASGSIDEAKAVKVMLNNVSKCVLARSARIEKILKQATV